MNARRLWSRFLVALGGLAMLVGAIDPLEGSVVILVGSGLVLLSTILGQAERRRRIYWIWTFALVAFGVAAMFALSAVGGIGEGTGYSLWWGLFILPYPLGWIMGMVGLSLRLVASLRDRRPGA